MLQTCHSARMLPIFWLLRRNKPLQFFKKEKLHMRAEAAISCTWVVITLLQHVKTCTKSRHTRYFQRALTFISWFIDGVQRDAVMCLVAGTVSGYYHTNPSLPSSFDRKHGDVLHTGHVRPMKLMCVSVSLPGPRKGSCHIAEASC